MDRGVPVMDREAPDENTSPLVMGTNGYRWNRERWQFVLLGAAPFGPTRASAEANTAQRPETGRVRAKHELTSVTV
jgi:hypothetical protein